jgi:iron-sulfur cluster repair protein YtfE (RIC family)
MNTQGRKPTSFSTMLEEHRELMGRIAELREWINQVSQLGTPRMGELGDRIQPLRDELARHFADEEQNGYLAEALAAAPRFTREAQELQAEHAEFLTQLDDLIARLHELEPPFASWQEACRKLEAILGRLRRHEGRETALVQSAFEEDVAPVD